MVNNFKISLKAIGFGFKVLLTQKQYRKFLYYPLLLLGCFYIVISWVFGVFAVTIFSYLSEIAANNEILIPKFLFFAAGIGVTIAVVLTGIIFATTIYNLIALPFWVKMVKILDAEKFNYSADEETVKKRSNLTLKLLCDNLKLTLVIFFWNIIILPITIFFPLIGAICHFLLNSYFLGYIAILYSAENHQLRHYELNQKLKQHRTKLIIIGSMIYFCYLLPLLIVLILPVAIIAGTWLFNTEIKLRHVNQPLSH